MRTTVRDARENYGETGAALENASGTVPLSNKSGAWKRSRIQRTSREYLLGSQAELSTLCESHTNALQWTARQGDALALDASRWLFGFDALEGGEGLLWSGAKWVPAAAARNQPHSTKDPSLLKIWLKRA